ncbi:MAG TPA: DEAD/DEAH box helicase family protein [Candidatus Binatia bacterium]|nr:DEAD/DEAH box helicase family protein [Candidatus Binatia bacterium]
MKSVDKIKFYRSLFRGRDDVFARRWEKTGGYFPDYTFDWNEFNAHKASGGTIKDFKNKQLTPLTDALINKHLIGQITIGIYPILEDNTTYFLAADFDGANWLNDCLVYQQGMDQIGLTSYIERSRSGNGGHVWIFFEAKYPCHKSRAFGLEVARRALGLSVFDREASFDRLFPNQDAISKGGFGNLIALPFQDDSARNGNTVFIDPVTTEPYEDQFSILKSIKRHSNAELEAAYYLATSGVVNETSTAKSKKLKISVSQSIILQKAQLNGSLGGFLKEQLNFLNTEYLTKKRFGLSLYQVEKYFRLIDETNKIISLPRGFLSRLLKFLYENGINYEVSFVMPKLSNAKFKSSIKLTDIQQSIVDLALVEKQGIIVAPPGSGKTMMGMELIARHQKPALILVHRKQLLDQWVDRIQKYLNIPKAHIGRFSGTKKTVGKEITVGLLQSFARSKDLSSYRDKFGTIIIDECHHIPAKTFREVIANLNPEFLYGLTATPERKHNDEQLIYVYIGDIIANMSDYVSDDTYEKSAHFETVIRETDLAIPFNWKTDQFDLIAKIISYDTTRNNLVANDILDQIKLGRKTLVLSERKEHLKVLELFLKAKCETLIFTGDDSVASRTSKMKQITDGHFQVLLATGQIFG